MTSVLHRPLPAIPVARSSGSTITSRSATLTTAVVGLGYVGLPTALGLAEAGHAVVAYDISEGRLADIKAGRADLLAHDQERLGRHLSSPVFSLTTEAGHLAAADAVIVCVPTPIDAHSVPDLRALATACDTVVDVARPGQTLILTSTTYAGSTRELLVERLQNRGLVVGVDVFVAFSAERIDPGNPAHLPESTPRVVGGVTPECARRAAVVLAASAPVVHMVSSPETAELTKLMENTFRAVNIAFANEFADVARTLNLDITEVIDAAATKPYGFMRFTPGPGVGGHCIPCDPHYLLWQLKAQRMHLPLTETAMTAIATRPHDVVVRTRDLLAERGTPIRGARVLLVGVTYKPGVTDLRESPALEILSELERHGAEVAFDDPAIDTLHLAGRVLERTSAPHTQVWDLVIAHTIDPSLDYSWLDDGHLVLDASYQLPRTANHRLL